MAEFEDNAVVTAEDLNNIAVDLGDTTFSAFSNEKFGVDKLNEITADIVGKGVLNIGNKCEAVLNVDTVYIQSGVIVFESGSKIRIESPVGVEASAGDYIYAYNDVTTGKASIQAAAEYPSSGDYVMLAQRTADGTIVDLRQYSVAKTTLSADVENNIVEQEVTVDFGYDGTGRLTPIVIPLLSSCKVFVLIGTPNHMWSFGGGYLSEDKLQIQKYHYNSGYEIYVQKIDGNLVFSGSTYITGTHTLKFILA